MSKTLGEQLKYLSPQDKERLEADGKIHDQTGEPISWDQLLNEFVGSSRGPLLNDSFPDRTRSDTGAERNRSR